MKLVHASIVLISLSVFVSVISCAVSCKLGAIRAHNSASSAHTPSERQVAFVSTVGLRPSNPFLQAHTCCPRPLWDLKHQYHDRQRRAVRTPAAVSVAMSSDKNLGTASCDLPSPTDVIAASLSKWLSLNDKDGSRAGKLRVISVDMDGTIADTRDRQRFAEEKSGVGPKPVKGVDGAPFFNVFLRGEYYSMDSPIPGAAEFLQQYIAPPTSGLIVYLSGRRQGTEGESRAWCRQHGFPDGIIVHRAKGMNSQRFKADFLLAIKASPLVRALDAHVGDRESDDGGAAAAAGVRFMHILHETGDGGPAPKPWPPFNDIALFGGP